jgi:RNA polymerase sigma factor (sigma-70 family)
MIKSSFVPKSGQKGGYNPFGESLYATVNKNVRRMAGKFYSILSDEDMEDLVHDTYLRVMDNREKADLDKNVNGWIYRICRNCVNDYTSAKSKRNGWMVDLDEDYDDEDSSYEAESNPMLADYTYVADRPLDYKEFEQNFWRSIERLSPEYRDVAIMLIDETPYSQMADELGCSEDTLRVRICRMRKALLKLGMAA